MHADAITSSRRVNTIQAIPQCRNPGPQLSTDAATTLLRRPQSVVHAFPLLCPGNPTNQAVSQCKSLVIDQGTQTQKPESTTNTSAQFVVGKHPQILHQILSYVFGGYAHPPRGVCVAYPPTCRKCRGITGLYSAHNTCTQPRVSQPAGV